MKKILTSFDLNLRPTTTDDLSNSTFDNTLPNTSLLPPVSSQKIKKIKLRLNKDTISELNNSMYDGNIPYNDPLPKVGNIAPGDVDGAYAIFWTLWRCPKPKGEPISKSNTMQCPCSTVRPCCGTITNQ
jgi:hypothetical protein